MAETTLTQIQSDDCHGVKAYVFFADMPSKRNWAIICLNQSASMLGYMCLPSQITDKVTLLSYLHFSRIDILCSTEASDFTSNLLF